MTNWIRAAEAVLFLVGFILVVTSVVVFRGPVWTDASALAQQSAPSISTGPRGTTVKFSDSMPMSESVALSFFGVIQRSVGELLQNMGHTLDLLKAVLLLEALTYLGLGEGSFIEPRIPILRSELHRA